jgi:methyl-accepting chemotaxis protein
MSYYDFQVYSLKHSIWKAKLRDFLEGKQSLTKEKAASHKDCDLGKWLYSEGLKKYENIRDMQKLEKVHEDLHATVRNIISLKESGDSSAAEVEYKKIGPISDELVALLAAIGEKVKSMGHS